MALLPSTWDGEGDVRRKFLEGKSQCLHEEDYKHHWVSVKVCFPPSADFLERENSHNPGEKGNVVERKLDFFKCLSLPTGLYNHVKILHDI